MTFEGIVHPRFNSNVDEFVSSSEQIWRNLALIYHFKI